MKSLRKKLVEKADKVFSLFIRARDNKEYGGCVFCGKPIQHNFHFITRAKHSTRWDELNCVASCAGCNYRMEFDSAPFHLWFINKYGIEKWMGLVLKSNKIAKFSNSDLEEIIKKYGGQ